MNERIRITHLLNHPEQTEKQIVQYEDSPVTVSLQGGEEVQVQLEGIINLPTICARCGDEYKLNLSLDTTFTAGTTESEWPLDKAGMINIYEIIDAAIQLQAPLLNYCDKCNK